MKNVLIIGGGLAGLTAAVYLVKNNFNVTLFEASPKSGGRVYSFNDVKTKTEIDNGQHIMMGCYSETRTLLNIINANHNFHFAGDGNNQHRLIVNYLDRNGEQFKLETSSLPYPFNLLSGLITFNAFSLSEKLSLIKFFLKLKFIDSDKLLNLNVKQWLVSENQSENVIKIFWEIISVGALNTSVEKASAKIFCDILKEIFWKDKISSLIILPSLPLSQSFINPLHDYLAKHNCKIQHSEKCTSSEIKNNRVEKIISATSDTSKRKVYDDFDYVISAIPFFALEKLIDKNILSVEPQLNYSSILNIHLWLSEIATDKIRNLNNEFYAFHNSELHWLFNKGTHWNIVISNADKFMEMTKEEIFQLVISEMKNFIPISEADIQYYKVIKEKRATFVPDEKAITSRPSTETKIENLFVAGDWVDTGLPATIESAVKSGRMAAEKIILKETNSKS